ncbi:UDP-N-acetylmuramoyl-L-alanyl-D-glutamate--2,6-diaminopimelate ligase [Cerasibacillus quisquiliarum]|uniref:UDP-N-acetylmuramoyl-L-alanyl-D-glutamate--2,6-diaminopimelate ligase n=1 Tax=Cerasibacillus quisquiliarum TaxID=227865 RepID=A0A511UUR9_9BACI|nr:UDP-N-acetylmuramoyl-L-alanyl-D-glutamate--2,6-diaminopimelate ligase [Cerasibacillus quisquiliarum]MBB5145769.1 UDP-N-acetylmuramoyl-L-alanyl-D-glutamate--2,6-diaminopimelate ligase [Cerasibacillus quisquiliarum]GEN30340.1 UDP-N-acetylmuramoyl-L-alanyl-D-glutamate--2,6-diaminopimelate ligase [Cerasibacillus quisquiliarum]
MKLIQLLKSLAFYRTTQPIDDHIEITDIHVDSRQVTSGSLFVCIRGFTVDGHDFVEEAVQKGATAIIAEKLIKHNENIPVIYVSDTTRALAMLSVHFYNDPTNELELIGVTGTNGKTTITYLLETIFKANQQRTGVIGTIQMKINDKAIETNNTTPDALNLQKAFRKMRDEDVNVAMMEVSSHALDQGRVFGCRFDTAIFTNLSQDHLDYHKDMNDYLRAKSLLFSQLGNDYPLNQKRFAIINEDDVASALLKKSTGQYVLTYGYHKQADVMAKNVKLHIDHTSFQLETPIGSIDIQSRLIGLFNVYNMLAAASAAICHNVSLHTIKEALESMTGVDGRFEPVVVGQDFGVIVDYAHTPDSLENVLTTIQEFANKKITVVVGCGGDRDRSKRPLMAQVAVKYADEAVFTSDNPRTEDPNQIIEDMVQGLNEKETNYTVIVDRKKAIEYAIQKAESEDIVIIAGKGHETYQQIGTEKIHFDDREVAREAIKNKGNC